MDPRTTSPSTPHAALSTRGARDYPGGYSDEGVIEIARADGEISAADPGYWGENAPAAYGAKLPVMTHPVQLGLISHTLRDTVQRLAGAIHAGVARLDRRTPEVKHEIDRWKFAALHLADIRHLRRLMRLGDPDRHTEVKRWGLLVLLFFGELGLLATALQSQGLSDRPLIPGLAFTDELHVAALATVAAMAMLGHAAGEGVRALQYTLDRRRLEPDPDVRAALPAPSRAHLTTGGVAAVIAVIMLMGMVMLRAEYLAAAESAVSSAPFVLTQLGLLAAAVWIAYHFSDPSAPALRAALADEAATGKVVTESMTEAEQLTAAVNTDAEGIAAAVAMAGAHARADAANADRQAGALYPTHVLRSLDEPVTEKLFVEGLPAVKHLSDAELLAALKGVTELPMLTGRDMTAIVRHYEAARMTIAEHAEELHEIEHERLHPGRKRARGKAVRAEAVAVAVAEAERTESVDHPAVTTESAPRATGLHLAAPAAGEAGRPSSSGTGESEVAA